MTLGSSSVQVRSRSIGSNCLLGQWGEGVWVWHGLSLLSERALSRVNPLLCCGGLIVPPSVSQFSLEGPRVCCTCQAHPCMEPLSTREQEGIPDGYRLAWSKTRRAYYMFNSKTKDAVWPKTQPCLLPPDCVALEMLRARRVEELRDEYRRQCARLGWASPPKESFNRWLFDRLSLGWQGDEPLVPGPCASKDDEAGASMRNEILEDLPVKIRPPLRFVRTAAEARAHLAEYAEGARRLMRLLDCPAEPARLVERALSSARDAVELDQGDDDERVVERVRRVRAECEPTLRRLALPTVEDVCRTMTRSAARPSTDRPLQGQPREATATEDRDRVVLACGAERLELSPGHYAKLRRLFGQHACAGPVSFETHAWCLLRRYRSVFGTGTFEGQGHQAAVPTAVFEALSRLLGVDWECFASPLNCHLDRYCSAFEDTDRCFGSRGSFFDLARDGDLGGSFQANPPFCEPLMARMADKMGRLLASAPRALSFVVVVPWWRDSGAVQALSGHAFLRASLLLEAKRHSYVVGFQHLPCSASRESLLYSAVHDTGVFVLQNDQGAAQWPATPAVMQELQRLWCG